MESVCWLRSFYSSWPSARNHDKLQLRTILCRLNPFSRACWACVLRERYLRCGIVNSWLRHRNEISFLLCTQGSHLRIFHDWRWATKRLFRFLGQRRWYTRHNYRSNQVDLINNSSFNHDDWLPGCFKWTELHFGLLLVHHPRAFQNLYNPTRLFIAVWT